MRGPAPADSALLMPRAKVVVAHADDESIALVGRMVRFQKAGFVHVTDGAPLNEQDSRSQGFQTLDDYRAARAQELAAMFAESGIRQATRICLNLRDQEASLNLAEITRQVAQYVADW